MQSSQLLYYQVSSTKKGQVIQGIQEEARIERTGHKTSYKLWCI